MKKYFAILLVGLFTAPALAERGRDVVKGTLDVTTEIRIIDDTTGQPETGVTSATSGIDLEYVRLGAQPTNLTESDLAATDSAHSDGGMIHLGGGRYRVDVPDAACASGVNQVTVQGTITGMIVIPVTHMLCDFSPYVATPPVNVTQFGGSAGTFASGIPAVNGVQIEGTDSTDFLNRLVTRFQSVVWIGTGDDAEAVIEAQSAGTKCFLSPGTHAMGGDQLIIPDNVHVVGAGRDVTIITSTLTAAVIMVPGDNSLLEGFTLQSLNSSSSPLDFPLGITSGSFTGSVWRNLRIIGWTDGVYVTTSSACSAIVDDVIIETKWDAWLSHNPTTPPAHTFDINRLVIHIREDNATADSASGAMFGGSSSARYLVRDSVVDVRAKTGATASLLEGMSNGGAGSQLVVFNSSIAVGSATTQATSIWVAGVGNPFTLVNCEFDRSLVAGTPNLNLRDRFSPLQPTTPTYKIALTSTGLVDLKDDAVDAGALATPAVDEIQANLAANGVKLTLTGLANVNTEVDTALSEYGALKPTTPGQTLDINSNGAAESNLTEVMSSLLTQSAAGRLAGNFSTFWNNSNAATTQTVDNVGSGGGGGSNDWSAEERNYWRWVFGIPGTQTAIPDWSPKALSLEQFEDKIAEQPNFDDLVSANGDIQDILSDTDELQIDITNGGRFDLLIDAIKAKTDNLPTDPADESNLTGLLNTLDAVADAIKLKTDNLPATPASETTVAAVKAKTDNLPSDPADQSDLAALVNTVDAVADAIKLKTDNLPSDPADQSDLAGLVNTVDAVADAIKLKTDTLPSSPASETTAAAIKAKTDNLPALPANEASLTAIKAKTDNLPASPAQEGTLTAVKNKTDNLPSDPADQSDVAGLVNMVDAVVDAIKLKTDTLPAAPANETTVAAVKAKTDNLPASPASESTVTAVKAKTDNLPASPANETTVAAVKAKTDNLPTDPADQSEVEDAIGTITANVDLTPVQSVVDAIKAKTDNLPAAPANETTLAAVKAKTDNLPAAPASESTITAVKAKTDNLPASPANETTLAAVKAKTDNLPSDPADQSLLVDAIGGAIEDVDLTPVMEVLDKVDAMIEADGMLYRWTTNALETTPTGEVNLGEFEELLDKQLTLLQTLHPPTIDPNRTWVMRRRTGPAGDGVGSTKLIPKKASASVKVYAEVANLLGGADQIGPLETIQVIDSDNAGVTISNIEKNGTVISFRVAGGTAGKKTDLEIRFQTPSGLPEACDAPLLITP